MSRTRSLLKLTQSARNLKSLRSSEEISLSQSAAFPRRKKDTPRRKLTKVQSTRRLQDTNRITLKISSENQKIKGNPRLKEISSRKARKFISKYSEHNYLNRKKIKYPFIKAKKIYIALETDSGIAQVFALLESDSSLGLYQRSLGSSDRREVSNVIGALSFEKLWYEYIWNYKNEKSKYVIVHPKDGEMLFFLENKSYMKTQHLRNYYLSNKLSEIFIFKERYTPFLELSM